MEDFTISQKNLCRISGLERSGIRKRVIEYRIPTKYKGREPYYRKSDADFLRYKTRNTPANAISFDTKQKIFELYLADQNIKRKEIAEACSIHVRVVYEHLAVFKKHNAIIMPSASNYLVY